MRIHVHKKFKNTDFLLIKTKLLMTSLYKVCSGLQSTAKTYLFLNVFLRSFCFRFPLGLRLDCPNNLASAMILFSGDL